jgi:D-tyrosyl-tRNA(Tyr) deacylase
MRCLIQRASEASVSVDGQVTGKIGNGLVILVCAMRDDTEAEARALAGKITKLRIFRDDQGRMNRSVLDAGGAALVVSQFTLAADTSRGNRPGFSAAAAPELGEALYQAFCRFLSELGIAVETGRFGADMKVYLVNDGPVTIWMDTAD